MKIATEITSLKRIFLLFMLSLSILAGAAFFYIYTDAKRDRINDLSYIAKVIKGYYELSFHQWELSLLSVGTRLIDIEDLDERLAFANKALQVYEKELLAFGLVRPDGQVTTLTGNAQNASSPNLMNSEKTKRSFQYAITQGGISLGESYYFDNVQDWILPIRVPLRDEKGGLIAINTSAIAYSNMISELEQFGFDKRYTIHLINNEFGTTQLYFPLDPKEYDQVLGSDQLEYQLEDSVRMNADTHYISSVDPILGSSIYGVCTQIQPVNHLLVVSMIKDVVIEDVMNRFRYVLLIYLFLISASFILFTYLRRNLQESINKLRSERANLIAIFESTNDLIGLFDNDKKIVAFNTPFEMSAKMTDGIQLKKGMDIFSEMKSQEHANAFRSFFDKALEGEKFREVVSYPGPDGEIVFRFTYNPIYQDKEIRGVSMFAEDITEIRKYQKQLENYNKNLEETVKNRTLELEKKNEELAEGYDQLKSTQQQLIRAEKMASLGILSAGIGHEINNPLNFIKHGSIALKMKLEELKTVNVEELKDYFRAIDEGVMRATNIVTGLSHYSRSGSKMDEDCDVHGILENCLTLLSNMYRSKPIEVRTSFEAKNAKVIGNDGKLHQVFTNLIANAVQAIPERGEVRITTKLRDNYIVIEIADTGTGMSEEVLSKLTDPFFTTKDPGVGTGLGLFITQLVIDEHDGMVEVESEVGKGSLFRITLLSKKQM